MSQKADILGKTFISIYSYLTVYIFFSIIQAVAGERFVDFRSDTEVKAPAATNEDVFSLSSVNGNNSSASRAIPIQGASNNVVNTNSGSLVNSGSYINNQSSSLISTSGIASYSATNTSNRGSRNMTSTSVPSTPTKLKSTSSFHIATPATYELWEKCASSRTGTSLALCAGNYYKQQAIGPLSATNSEHNNTSSKNNNNSTSAASKAPIAPLVLTWRGSEPLDKLHLSLRVKPFPSIAALTLIVFCFELSLISS